MSRTLCTDDRRRQALALLAGGMIVAAATTRLLPHPPNFTPALAVGVFGGARLDDRRVAFAVPLLSMAVSDLGLELLRGSGLHVLMPVVYAAVAACVFLGFALRTRSGLGWTVAVATAASVQFYLLTNFAVWCLGTLYPMTAAGLGECFVAALPFFRNTFVSTVGYTLALLALHAAVGSRLARTAHIR